MALGRRSMVRGLSEQQRSGILQRYAMVWRFELKNVTSNLVNVFSVCTCIMMLHVYLSVLSKLVSKLVTRKLSTDFSLFGFHVALRSTPWSLEKKNVVRKLVNWLFSRASWLMTDDGHFGDLQVSKLTRKLLTHHTTKHVFLVHNSTLSHSSLRGRSLLGDAPSDCFCVVVFPNHKEHLRSGIWSRSVSYFDNIGRGTMLSFIESASSEDNGWGVVLMNPNQRRIESQTFQTKMKYDVPNTGRMTESITIPRHESSGAHTVEMWRHFILPKVVKLWKCKLLI